MMKPNTTEPEHGTSADDIFRLLEEARAERLEFQELQALDVLETMKPEESGSAFTWEHPLTLTIRDSNKD